MRKLLLLAFAVAPLSLPAAIPVLSTNWQIDVGTENWFANDSAARGAAYSATTDNVYVATRTGGNRVIVLDAATGGSTVSTELDNTGVTGGTFGINEVAVADDGVIYACNLTTNAATTLFKIYRWANDGAAPTVAYSATGEVSARTGDSFTVTGSGNGTVIYASGSGNNNIEVFTTADGVNFTIAAPIAIPGASDFARGGIDVRPDNGNLIIDEQGSAPREITTGGALVATGDTGIIGISFHASDLIVNGGGQVLLGSEIGNVQPALGRIWDVTAGLASPTTIFETPGLGSNPNSNGTGQFVWDTTREAAIVLSTNNALGSYGLNIPVELSVFSAE